MSTSLKYLQSKQAAERNSTSDRETISDKPEEDVMKPLSYRDSTDAIFLWELRKYVLLQATLAATITYSAGLTPQGGFWWWDNHNIRNGGNLTGDRVLQVTYPRRYGIFFYFNATAFVASVVTINLLLVQPLSCRRWWLRALQATMILNLLGLMGAYAAGSCRKVAMSAYVLALVSMVSSYVCTHVIFFALWSLRARHGSSKSPMPKVPEAVERVRKNLLIFATSVVTVTYPAGLSMPGRSLSSDSPDQDHLAGEPMLDGHMVFFYLNTTAFVASLVIIMLLMSRTVLRHGFRSWALWVCTGASLVGLTGAFATGSSRSTKTSVYVVALVAAVLLYVGLQILKRHNLEESVPECLKTLFEPQTEEEDDAEMRWKLEKSRKLLLLLAILAAGLTYQAGMSPPGGFWQENKTGHTVSNPVLSDNYPRRYLAFFYCNATAFVASLAIIMLLVNRELPTRGIQSYALRVCVILDLVGLMGAFAAGSARKVSTSIYVFILVFAVLICMALQVVLVVSKSVQGLLKGILSFFKVTAEEDSGDKDKLPHTAADAELREPCLDKLPKYLLLLAALVAAVTYQAAMNPPGGLWGNGQAGHIPGDPVLRSTYPRRYKAFFYCNATSFMASLVIMVLLLRLSSAQSVIPGIKYCILQVAMILYRLRLIGMFAAGSCSKSKLPVERDHPNRPVKRSNRRDAIWRVALAAPHHMTGNQSLLQDCVHNGDDGEGVVIHPATNGEVPLRAQGSGSVRTETIALDDVWYVPGLDSNLVSTGQLARQGCSISLGLGGSRITRGGALVGTARFTEASQFELDFLKIAYEPICPASGTAK